MIGAKLLFIDKESQSLNKNLGGEFGLEVKDSFKIVQREFFWLFFIHKYELMTAFFMFGIFKVLVVPFLYELFDIGVVWYKKIFGLVR